MVKWTILIAAYTAGCIWLSMRRMEASGTGPKTPRGRLREMGWGLALLALAVSLFGLNGVNHWPTLIAMLIAGLVLVLLPRQAAWLVAVMLIALGLYGFLLVRAYQRGDPVQKLYGLVLAGAGSYRTEFVLPQAYVFLVLGLWLLWRTVGPALPPGQAAARAQAMVAPAAPAGGRGGHRAGSARTTGSARAGGASCGTWPRRRPCSSSCGGSRPARRIWRRPA